MALSASLGLWDSGLGAGLRPSHTILAGVRDVDPPEEEIIARTGVCRVPPGPHFVKELRQAIAGRPVYIHIDCDVLEPGIVPTDYLVPGGLGLAELREPCAAIIDSKIVGIEIAEVETRSGNEDPAPLMGALDPPLQTLV